MVTPDGRDGSMVIRQDASIYASVLASGERVRHEIGDGRGVWVQVAVGGVTVNGQSLAEGDGLAVEDESALEIVGGAERSEVLLFDLA